MLQKALQNAIFTAFGLSTEKYDGIMITGSMPEWRVFYNREYVKAKRYFEEIKSNMDMRHISNRQFVRFWETMFRYAKNQISRKEKEEQLWEMFQKDIPNDRNAKE